MDVEKKAPHEEVDAKFDIDNGQAQVYGNRLEDEKRVRWKIDMVVLPMVSLIYPKLRNSETDEQQDVPRILHPVPR